jgi:hypothetical protein
VGKPGGGGAGLPFPVEIVAPPTEGVVPARISFNRQDLHQPVMRKVTNPVPVVTLLSLGRRHRGQEEMKKAEPEAMASGLLARFGRG